MLASAFKVQARVVGALILRELHARYGREHLGFLWLIAEPLMFALGVMLMWQILSGPYVHDLPIVPVTMFGYIPLLLYRHMTNGSMRYLRANSALLFHQRVTLFDLYFSRVVTETAGNILAFAVAYAVVYELGEVQLPANVELSISGISIALGGRQRSRRSSCH